MKKFISSLLCVILLLGFALSATAAEPKLIALTFDDGPHSEHTPHLLDELDKRNAKCTFFVMGNSLMDFHGDIVEANAEIIRRAHAEGHQIANHGYSHPNFRDLSDNEIRAELEKTESALRRMLGEGEYMVRTPYGADGLNTRVLAAAERPVILWSINPEWNARRPTEEDMYRHIMDKAADGAIVLLHDFTGDRDINAAVRAIDTLKARGYEFVTVAELMRLRNVAPEKGKTYYSIPEELPFDESKLNSHWAYDSIVFAMEKGIMQGDGVGFKPNEKLTRAMAVTLLHRAAGAPEARSAPFTDLGQDWYKTAVGWAYEEGLINGMGGGTFAPDKAMTKEQFYTLICRWADIEGMGGQTMVFPDDHRISPWAKDSIMQIRNRSFRSENDVEIFRPQAAISRAEASELLHWILENEETLCMK